MWTLHEILEVVDYAKIYLGEEDGKYWIEYLYNSELEGMKIYWMSNRDLEGLLQEVRIELGL